jgi:hypothetical protein
MIDFEKILLDCIVYLIQHIEDNNIFSKIINKNICDIGVKIVVKKLSKIKIDTIITILCLIFAKEDITQIDINTINDYVNYINDENTINTQSVRFAKIKVLYNQILDILIVNNIQSSYCNLIKKYIEPLDSKKELTITVKLMNIIVKVLIESRNILTFKIDNNAGDDNNGWDIIDDAEYMEIVDTERDGMRNIYKNIEELESSVLTRVLNYKLNIGDEQDEEAKSISEEIIKKIIIQRDKLVDEFNTKYDTNLKKPSYDNYMNMDDSADINIFHSSNSSGSIDSTDYKDIDTNSKDSNEPDTSSKDSNESNTWRSTGAESKKGGHKLKNSKKWQTKKYNCNKMYKKTNKNINELRNNNKSKKQKLLKNIIKNNSSIRNSRSTSKTI